MISQSLFHRYSMNTQRLFFSLATAALCGVSTARATSIIYSGVRDIPIPTTFAGIFLDLDTGVTGGPAFPGSDINPFFGGVGIANSAAFQPVRVGSGHFDAYRNVASGTLIDASIPSYSTGDGGSDTAHLGSGAGEFHEGTDGYLGFEFTTDTNAGPYFGWMRVSLTNDTAGALIRDWAYDNSGAGIAAGVVVPEPAATALLVGGIGGLLGLRSRRA